MSADVHLITNSRPAAVVDLLSAAAREGRETVVVLLQDAVIDAQCLALRRHASRLAVLGDDCRRRGVTPPSDAIDHEALVDLIAGAQRVASW